MVYGRTGKALSIDLDALEFVNNAKGISESTIVTINVDGTTHQAFVKDTQRNITTGQVLHIDFYEVEAGVTLRAKVSVHVHGNPVGVREGGILEAPLHDIDVECLPKDLPERLDVDIAELKVNQSIHVRDIAIIIAVQNLLLQLRPEFRVDRMGNILVLSYPRFPARHGDKHAALPFDNFYIVDDETVIKCNRHISL
ncbi:hypothetical protein AGMMS49944_30360 [Spirochaetia bacterium]|nr:hypothetical protein AGMMS49944_30360 [Spirochaetia bacterium]